MDDEPILCPIQPSMAKRLKDTGFEFQGRCRISLATDNTLTFEVIHDCFLANCDHFAQVQAAIEAALNGKAR